MECPLYKKIKAYDIKIEAIFKSNPTCLKISEVEGVGTTTAIAIVTAIIGVPHIFKNGRHFSAFLGLIPRQYSSGSKVRLLGISKRGDTYLRTLLMHGARCSVRYIETKEDRRSKWIIKLKEHRGANRAAVAVANKIDS